jgi:hypothetical protein
MFCSSPMIFASRPTDTSAAVGCQRPSVAVHIVVVKLLIATSSPLHPPFFSRVVNPVSISLSISCIISPPFSLYCSTFLVQMVYSLVSSRFHTLSLARSRKDVHFNRFLLCLVHCYCISLLAFFRSFGVSAAIQPRDDQSPLALSPLNVQMKRVTNVEKFLICKQKSPNI